MDTTIWIQLISSWGVPLVLLALGYGVGTSVERSHYRSLRIREARMRSLPALNLQRPPAHWKIAGAGMVTGSVVVSVDYFKRFLAGLRGLVGGRIRVYESLLDRGRREALLRMKEGARQQGYDAIVNVRLETSRMASSRRDGKGTAGVEVLAFGTAVRIAR